MSKFELNNKVYIKSKDTTGEITQYKHEKYKRGTGEVVETYKYLVKTNSHYSDWFDESDLSFVNEFDNKFEVGLIDLLIDVNLKENNLDTVKELHKQKQQYEKR